MRSQRIQAIFAIVLLAAMSSFAQDRTTWRTAADIQEGARGSIVGTVADVDEARNEIELEPDDDTGPRITVMSDSVSTQYNGFGGTINGHAEIFIGSQGLSNLRSGDRIEVRGLGSGTEIRADVITLRERETASSPTGVGTTRTPTSISPPSATSTSTADRVAPVEGTVQEVNAADGRIVIVTDRREVMTVRTSGITPVYYKGDTYRVSNLEIGDRVRIDPESGGGGGGELRARAISVTRSSQEGTATPRGTTLTGRVTRVDRTLDIVWVDTGRVSNRVDVATASDTVGRRVRALDFQVGDHVELSGRYSPTASDLFIASTVRFADDNASPTAPRDNGTPGPNVDMNALPSTVSTELGAVTLYGSIRETLAESPQLVLRDSSGRTIRLNVIEDFVVRGKAGGFVTADKLHAGDSVVVKAYRDADGNYIAQTIRIR